jgi:outer membrane protein TolC
MMITILLTLFLLPAVAASPSPGPLIEAALSAHPSLAALEAQIDALEATAGGAGTWADPVVGLELSNLPLFTFGLGDHPMAGVQIKVQQRLPAPGTHTADQQAADARIAVAEHTLNEARDALARQISQAWWDLTLSRQLEVVTRTHLARTDELHQAVLARYEVGAAGQHAVVRLEVLRDRLQDDLADFVSHQAALTASLAVATAKTVSPPFDTVANLAPLALSGTTESWLELATTNRPELARLAAQATAAEAAAWAASLSSRPEPTVWMGYRLRTYADDPRDLASIGVSMPLPTGSRIRADATQATHLARGNAARASLDARMLTLEGELAATEARWTRAEQKSATYSQELLPAANAAVETTLADYALGAATFSNLYEAEIMVLDLERTWRVAVIDTWRADTDMRALVGLPYPGDTP